jgi:hypothetical protein
MRPRGISTREEYVCIAVETRGTSIIRSFAHFIVARPPAGNFSPTFYELPPTKAALGEWKEARRNRYFADESNSEL